MTSHSDPGVNDDLVSSRTIRVRSTSSRSVISNESRSSKARVEAARVRAAYALKEAELRKQEAAINEEEIINMARVRRRKFELEVDRQLLHQQKVCAETEAEAEADTWVVLSEVGEDTLSETNERVKQFVEQSGSGDNIDEDIPQPIYEHSRSLIENQSRLPDVNSDGAQQIYEHSCSPSDNQSRLPDVNSDPAQQIYKHSRSPSDNQSRLPDVNSDPAQQIYEHSRSLSDNQSRIPDVNSDRAQQIYEHSRSLGFQQSRSLDVNSNGPQQINEHSRSLVFQQAVLPDVNSATLQHRFYEQSHLPVINGNHLQQASCEQSGLPDANGNDNQLRSYEHLPYSGSQCDNTKQTEYTSPNSLPLSVTIATELSKFLVKKDLLLARLICFNDLPEKYVSWKCSFSQVTKEMGVSAPEELDLLIKWLGPESKKHAVSIRAANIHDPANGLRKVWERLDERYGSPETVEAALKKKIAEFPKIGRDNKKLYELSDLLYEVEATMLNASYQSVLGYFNSSTGVNPIVQKLPFHMQSKWMQKATNYMRDHQATFPPFHIFCEFIKDMSSMLNNPCFVYEDKSGNDKSTSSVKKPGPNQTVRSFKTEVENGQNPHGKASEEVCSFHNSPGHVLDTCRTFRNKPLNVRKKFFREKNLCFKCGKANHRAQRCREEVICTVCHMNNHPTALHMYGGEANFNNNLNSACTEVCENEVSPGQSCAKVVLVTVHPKNNPREKKRMYALIDDQSNRSLAKPEFFDAFKERYSKVDYALSSCACVINTSGRRTTPEDFVITNIDGTSTLPLPALTECSQLPNVRNEIPTPRSARYHKHLQDLADKIPELDNSSEILLLLGRDITEAHHVLEQRTGPKGSPYAQRLYLGWVVIGETCLGKVHQPMINVNKTFIHRDGRGSIFQE